MRAEKISAKNFPRPCCESFTANCGVGKAVEGFDPGNFSVIYATIRDSPYVLIENRAVNQSRIALAPIRLHAHAYGETDRAKFVRIDGKNLLALQAHGRPGRIL